MVIAGGSLLRADDSSPTVVAKRMRRRHRRVITTTTTVATAPVGRSIDDLSGEVTNLRQESAQTTTEVKQIQQAIVVAPPATATTAPKTIGEHVSVLEQQVGDVRKTLSDSLGVHIHGLVDGTYDYNINQPNTTPILSSSGRVNQLRAFDVDANSFNFQQFNLHIDRTADGGVGFVTDLNFGKTAEVLYASTHYSNSLTPQSTQEFDPTQAYLTYTIPLGKGINMQAGKFVTLLGAEVIPVYNNLNFNESRGFLFTFGEPLTHTGVRAQYSFNDKIGLTMGLNNGWDDPSDNNDGKTVEGELSITPTSNLSILINGTYGPEQANHGNSKRGAIDPVVTWHTPLKGLQLIGEYIYATESSPIAVSAFPTSKGNMLTGVTTLNQATDWQGFAGYAVYDFNDNIEFASRFEWFRDSQGTRTGLRQTLFEFTETLNYKVPLVTGLLARLEYRHDASSANPFYSNDPLIAQPTNPVTFLPSHTYSGQDTLLAAAIYSF
ncbi:MAG TPA: outer membrane beta-barrel protein [Candidatus Binataceae bacterium]